MNPIIVFLIIFALESISFFGYSKVASIVSIKFKKNHLSSHSFYSL